MWRSIASNALDYEMFLIIYSIYFWEIHCIGLIIILVLNHDSWYKYMYITNTNVSSSNSLIAVGFNFFALHSNYTQPACNVNKRLYNKGETTLKLHSDYTQFTLRLHSDSTQTPCRLHADSTQNDVNMLLSSTVYVRFIMKLQTTLSVLWINEFK